MFLITLSSFQKYLYTIDTQFGINYILVEGGVIRSSFLRMTSEMRGFEPLVDLTQHILSKDAR